MLIKRIEIISLYNKVFFLEDDNENADIPPTFSCPQM
jgi:hypothetical protein